MDAERLTRAWLAIVPYYSDDKLAVELLDGDTSCILRGAVAWDAGKARWHVLANAAFDNKTIAGILFHELAHALHADVTKAIDGLASLDADRDLILGRVSAGEKVGRSWAWRARQRAPKARRAEDRAERWAAGELDLWWSWLQYGDVDAIRARVNQAKSAGWAWLNS